MGVHVSNAATEAILCEKAEEKWRAYYSNLYYPEQNYLLVYKDGQIVNFLPGTNEPFTGSLALLISVYAPLRIITACL